MLSHQSLLVTGLDLGFISKIIEAFCRTFVRYYSDRNVSIKRLDKI